MIEVKPSPIQRKFLEAEERIVFFGGGGGGGKTWSILVDNLQGVHDPAYFSVFFRSTTTEIDKGLWPEAKLMYMPLLKDVDGRYIGLAHINEQSKTITFPTGARSCFTYLELDKNADSWYGSELTKIYFDEFQFRTQYQFDVLRSRNRSRADVRKGIRCTLNPDPDHFVYGWIRPFLDEKGEFPDRSLSGKTRYYVILEGELMTSWDCEELSNKTGKKPQTYTYIPATLEDNEFLTKLDPEYRDLLDSLPEQKRKQLLLGSWARSQDSECLWQRQWVRGENGEMVIKGKNIPEGCLEMRGVDKAHSLPTDANKNPDYTALSAKISKSRHGLYYLSGDYHPDIKDPTDKHGNKQPLGRFRKLAGERDTLIARQAEYDGKNCSVVLTKDSGAGKGDHTYTLAKLTESGIKVVEDATSSTVAGKKVKDFLPFANACQLGLVLIAEDTFEASTLEAIYMELEKFDGERSTRTKKDDWADAFAMTFNAISPAKQHKIIVRNQSASVSLCKELLENKLKH